MKFEEPWDRPLPNFYLYFAEGSAECGVANRKYGVGGGGSEMPYFICILLLMYHLGGRQWMGSLKFE